MSKWLDEPVSAGARKLINKRAKPVHKASALRAQGVPLKAADNTRVSLNKLKAKSGTRYFVGFTNFYALTRYNPSNKYAMAIVELAKAIKDK